MDTLSLADYILIAVVCVQFDCMSSYLSNLLIYTLFYSMLYPWHITNILKLTQFYINFILFWYFVYLPFYLYFTLYILFFISQWIESTFYHANSNWNHLIKQNYKSLFEASIFKVKLILCLLWFFVS